MNTPEQRAERFGFLSAEAQIARHKNPYLKLLLESRRSDQKKRVITQLLAGAWWRGWDRGASPDGRQDRQLALCAFGLHALDGSQSFE